MKIGIFGGTFNPIHNGHLNLINSFDTAIGLDKILCIPTNIPPHKSEDNIISGKDRLNMLAIATAENKKISPCDVELKTSGKSYTYNTLIMLRKIYFQDDFYLLMGSDMFLSFDKWFKYKDIFSLATICCASRQNGDNDALVKKSIEYKKQGGKIIIIKNHVKVLSSSQIREKITNKISIENDIPIEVIKYIKEKNLYNYGCQ